MNKYKKFILKTLCVSAGILLILKNDSYANTSINAIDKSIHKYHFSQDTSVNIDEIRSTSDGGKIAVGYTSYNDNGFSVKGGEDAIIIKYDKDYNIEWKNSFGGTSADYFEDVTEVEDGGFVAVGYSLSSDANFIYKGNYDGIIVKYSKEGTQQWVTSFGGSASDELSGVAPVEDNGFIVTGHIVSSNSGLQKKGYKDAILIKYDAQGTLEWAKNWGYTNTHSEFNSVIKTKDENYAVVGGLAAPLINSNDTANTNMVAVMITFNKEGEEINRVNWETVHYSTYSKIIQTSDGGFACAGEYKSGYTDDEEYAGGQRDMFVVKYDKDKNVSWVGKAGGDNSDLSGKIVENKKGDIIVVGTTLSKGNGFTTAGTFDVYMVVYSKDGQEKVRRTFGGTKMETPFVIFESDEYIVFQMSSNSPEITGGGTNTVTVYYNYEYEHIFDKLEVAEMDGNMKNIDIARASINVIPDDIFKEYFQDRLNKVLLNEKLELKTSSANLDVYIKSQNMLSIALDTNSITFENYSGVADMEKLEAVNIVVNSSLPYQLNAYMPTEIYNSDRSNKIEMDLFSIKESSEGIYQQFENTTDKLVLKENCLNGNGLNHKIDFKLAGSNAHVADIYKTTIKFEVEQK